MAGNDVEDANRKISRKPDTKTGSRDKAADSLKFFNRDHTAAVGAGLDEGEDAKSETESVRDKTTDRTADR